MHWYDRIAGADVFEPPGGRLEPGESPLEAARREPAEELPEGVDPPELPEIIERLTRSQRPA